MSSRRASLPSSSRARSWPAAAGATTTGTRPPSRRPRPRPEQFPRAKGKTLAELRSELPKGGPGAGALGRRSSCSARTGSASGCSPPRGPRSPTPRAAVYVAPVGGGEAQGPFVARYESLEVKPQFRSQSLGRRPGRGEDALRGRRAVRASPGSTRCSAWRGSTAAWWRPPRRCRRSPWRRRTSRARRGRQGAGDPHARPRPTSAATSSRSTRACRPSTCTRPTSPTWSARSRCVLLFATPRLCQSRVCGPVVDVAEQVKADYGDQAEFIHMEIYNDNEINKGLRPQLAAFRLPTEPWAFAIGADGQGGGAARGRLQRARARGRGAEGAPELGAGDVARPAPARGRLPGLRGPRGGGRAAARPALARRASLLGHARPGGALDLDRALGRALAGERALDRARRPRAGGARRRRRGRARATQHAGPPGPGAGGGERRLLRGRRQPRGSAGAARRADQRAGGRAQRAAAGQRPGGGGAALRGLGRGGGRGAAARRSQPAPGPGAGLRRARRRSPHRAPGRRHHLHRSQRARGSTRRSGARRCRASGAG